MQTLTPRFDKISHHPKIASDKQIIANSSRGVKVKNELWNIYALITETYLTDGYFPKFDTARTDAYGYVFAELGIVFQPIEFETAIPQWDDTLAIYYQ